MPRASSRLKSAGNAAAPAESVGVPRPLDWRVFCGCSGGDPENRARELGQGAPKAHMANVHNRAAHPSL
eukprot:7229572-Prymnesium_polylepis.1